MEQVPRAGHDDRPWVTASGALGGRAAIERRYAGGTSGSERFYVIESGRAEVVLDGRVVDTLGGGDCFGEIALLRDRPRTATVRASADAHLRVSVLQRNAYLTAVTGYPASSAAGHEVVAARLKADAELPPTASDAH